jgi:hypothetical protein
MWECRSDLRTLLLLDVNRPISQAPPSPPEVYVLTRSFIRLVHLRLATCSCLSTQFVSSHGFHELYES